MRMECMQSGCGYDDQADFYISQKACVLVATTKILEHDVRSCDCEQLSWGPRSDPGREGWVGALLCLSQGCAPQHGKTADVVSRD